MTAATLSKDEGPGARDTQAPKEQNTADAGLCADATPDRKRYATLQAGLARRGYELRRGDGNALFIVRWGLIREVNGIDGATSFARQVGCSA